MNGPGPDVRAKLRGLHTTTKRLADGRVCVYAYLERGGPQLAKGVGRGLPEANAALETALGDKDILRRIAGLKEELRPRQSDRHIFGLVTAFLASPEFAKLAPSSKAAYQHYLDKFRDEFGEDRVSMFEDPASVEDLTAWRDEMAETPRAADYAIQSVGRLFAWARSRGKTRAEPTKDIAKLHKADRADVIWTPEEIAGVCAKATKEVQWAIKLAAFTGLRQGDLLRLTWAGVSDAAISLRTSKRKRLAVIPLVPEARELLDGIPRRAVAVLTSSTGQPWTSDGFRASFRRACVDAGVRKHFHDLRGTAATRFASAGVLTNVEIATVMGWSPERVDQLKALYVSADVVALDMLKRMGQKHAATNQHKPEGDSPEGGR